MFSNNFYEELPDTVAVDLRLCLFPWHPWNCHWFVCWRDYIQMTFLLLEYWSINTLTQCRYMYVYSNTRDDFIFVTVWFNNNIQDFVQILESSIEIMLPWFMSYEVLKVCIILQDSIPRLHPRISMVDGNCRAKSVKSTSLLLNL